MFLPIVFVEGITKQLFTDLALTMTYSLLASLIVALTLAPAMASGMLKKEKAVKAGLLERVWCATNSRHARDDLCRSADACKALAARRNA